jgi:hypothetical protein
VRTALIAFARGMMAGPRFELGQLGHLDALGRAAQ